MKARLQAYKTFDFPHVVIDLRFSKWAAFFFFLLSSVTLNLEPFFFSSNANNALNHGATTSIKSPGLCLHQLLKPTLPLCGKGTKALSIRCSAYPDNRCEHCLHGRQPKLTDVGTAFGKAFNEKVCVFKTLAEAIKSNLSRSYKAAI